MLAQTHRERGGRLNAQDRRCQPGAWKTCVAQKLHLFGGESTLWANYEEDGLGRWWQLLQEWGAPWQQGKALSPRHDLGQLFEGQGLGMELRGARTPALLTNFLHDGVPASHPAWAEVFPPHHTAGTMERPDLADPHLGATPNEVIAAGAFGPGGGQPHFSKRKLGIGMGA